MSYFVGDRDKIEVMKSILLKQNLYTRYATRNCRGFGFAEIASASFFLIFAVIVGIDCWFLIMAAPLNDAACRDAARAAAQASDSTTATNLALSAVMSHANQGSPFVQAPQLVLPIVYNDFGASGTASGQADVIPDNSSPYVTCTTNCVVRPIIPLDIFGNHIIGSDNSITFTQIYTFPIIKTKAMTVLAGGGPGIGGGGGNGNGNGNNGNGNGTGTGTGTSSTGVGTGTGTGTGTGNGTGGGPSMSTGGGPGGGP